MGKKKSLRRPKHSITEVVESDEGEGTGWKSLRREVKLPVEWERARLKEQRADWIQLFQILSYRHGDEPLGKVKDRQCLGYLNEHHLPKNGFAPSR